MALGIASRAPLAHGNREPVPVPRTAGFSGDQAEQQLLRNEQRQATEIAAAFGEGPAKHFGNQPA
jgi:hypothetical protein